jgi:hypothetical protein
MPPTTLSDRTQLKTWLQDKPVEWAKALITRAALRSLPPLILQDIAQDGNHWGTISAFKVSFLLWCGQSNPSHSQLIENITRDKAGDLGVTGPLSSALSSIKFPNASRVHASFGIEYAALMCGGWKDVAKEILDDALTLEKTQGSVNGLLLKKLWISEPKIVGNYWTSVRRKLPTHFAPWLEWYEGRRRGRDTAFELPPELDAAVQQWITNQSRQFWVQKAEQVNLQLQEQIEAVKNNLETDSRDFFISYASADADSAYEVSNVLSSHGYSVFAQFKDMGPGTNFVREMQRGLRVSSRMIALLSPDYEKSDHCQSEWAAAYNLDPRGADAKIIPFLLRPTELSPLARQIVYTDLSSLQEAERRATILAAVQRVQRARSRAEVLMSAAELASPVVESKNGKIDAKPNPFFDLPRADDSLADLPTTLREIAETIAEALPGNAPPVARSCLSRYASHVQQRGTRPIIGLLNAWISPLDKEFHSVEFEFWGAGLSNLFGTLFAKHALFITHFPKSPERERFLSETPINEKVASGERLTDPVKEASEALAEVAAEGLTSSGFDDVVADQQVQARDLAALPPDEHEQPSAIITPKRRFVLGTIGFYERTIIALGAIATVTSAPSIAAAIAALQSAVDRLLSLVL